MTRGLPRDDFPERGHESPWPCLGWDRGGIPAIGLSWDMVMMAVDNNSPRSPEVISANRMPSALAQGSQGPQVHGPGPAGEQRVDHHVAHEEGAEQQVAAPPHREDLLKGPPPSKHSAILPTGNLSQ